MATELEIQSRLVKAIKDAGGFGYKLNNKFLAGPPDLYLTHKDTGPVFIEVKKNFQGQKNVQTTPLQRVTMQNMKKAGTRCGVAVIIPLPNLFGGYDIYITSNTESLRIDDSWLMLHKKKGGDWPILEMMRACDTLTHSGASDVMV